MIKVNGINYGWGDVDVKIPGLNLVVQEISYDDEQEMEESYGRGNPPRGYGKGNYKASGKMSMLRDDYDDVLDYGLSYGQYLLNHTNCVLPHPYISIWPTFRPVHSQVRQSIVDILTMGIF